jgi:hypothetical protein
MASVSKLIDRELVWERTRDKEPWYVLGRDGEEWIRMRLARRMGTLAQAQAEGVAWTFKRTGVFHPHVTVRTEGSEANLAVFTPSWNGSGHLEFADGHLLRWQPTRSFGREWSWVTADKEILMRFQGQPLRCRVRFESAIRAEKEPALLVALGHYLIQLMSNDAALLAGVAAVTAATTAAVS